jgi:hypothetical protein
MKNSFIALAIVLGSISASAAQKPSVEVSINGAKAAVLFNAMSNSAGSEYVENEQGFTTLQNGTVSCTMYGSHGDGYRAKNPIYSCDIEIK